MRIALSAKFKVEKPVKKKALTAAERKRAVKLGEAMLKIEKKFVARKAKKKVSKKDFSPKVSSWLEDKKNIRGVNKWAVEFVKNLCVRSITEEKFFDKISVKIADIQGFNPHLWREVEDLDSLRHSIAEHFGIDSL